MIFGERPVAQAAGCILAHSQRAGASLFRKGRRLSAEDVAELISAGVVQVMVAELQPGDTGEDEAAATIAAALAGEHLNTQAPFTGRCNLHAGRRGLLLVDRARLDALNLVSESITVATLEPWSLIGPGEMAATVKIIPFAVPDGDVARCRELARMGPPLLRLAPLKSRSAILIQTMLPGTRPAVLDKTAVATRIRLEELDSELSADRRCGHRVTELVDELRKAAAGGPGLILVSGASAITDRRDVIPAALESAGGRVAHFGMPVDPGNLLMIGQLGPVPVLGLPGCARSPRVNGFDWVLRRLLCDLPVGREDIMRMGAGGLLKEIPSRPQPRAGAGGARVAAAPRIAAIVLAAGRSIRMGSNKLLAELDGQALICKAVDAVLASPARPVIVVTGHEGERVGAALAGRPVSIIANAEYPSGLASSLISGLTAVPAESDAVLVCLGDMPRVTPALLHMLIAAFNPLEGRAICVPIWNGKRGNPVLWGRQLFSEMAELTGDVGAKHLMARHAELVTEVPAEDDGVLADIDTPEALAALRREA